MGALAPGQPATPPPTPPGSTKREPFARRAFGKKIHLVALKSELLCPSYVQKTELCKKNRPMSKDYDYD